MMPSYWDINAEGYASTTTEAEKKKHSPFDNAMAS